VWEFEAENGVVRPYLLKRNTSLHHRSLLLLTSFFCEYPLRLAPEVLCSQNPIGNRFTFSIWIGMDGVDAFTGFGGFDEDTRWASLHPWAPRRGMRHSAASASCQLIGVPHVCVDVFADPTESVGSRRRLGVASARKPQPPDNIVLATHATRRSALLGKLRQCRTATTTLCSLPCLCGALRVCLQPRARRAHCHSNAPPIETPSCQCTASD
jgi:hypothetical protein